MHAKYLDHSSWTILQTGSKFSLCSQLTADVSSEQPSRQERGVIMPFLASIHMVMIVTMYYNSLFVWIYLKLGGI